MAGGGRPERTGINWPAAAIAFQLLMAIIAGLMAYAYINGGSAEKLATLKARLDGLEAQIRSLQAADAQINEINGRMDRLERRH